MANNPLPSTGHAPGAFQDNRLKIIVVGIVGIAASLAIAMWLPGASEKSLISAAIGFIGLIYIFGLSQFAYIFAFLMAATYLQMQPLGFLISTEDIIGAIFFPVFLFNIWRKDTPSTIIIQGKTFVYQTIFLIASTYLILHLWYTWRDPYFPFILRNIIKTYYTLIFAFSLIYWFSVKPPHLYLPKRPLTLIGFALFFGLLINIVIRGYGTYFLGLGTNEFEPLGVSDNTTLSIPLLNITENPYALRGLCPFAALVATIFLTTKLPEMRRPLTCLLFGSIIFLSIIGSLVSMGRATLIFTFCLIGIALLWRRHYGYLITLGVLGLLMISTLRIAYDLNPALIPKPVARSIAIIPGMQMESAKSNIQGSSTWRYEIFTRALEEWQSHPRVFWFGRSTGGVENVDISQFLIPEFKDEVMTDLTIKRGNTHNLITDYLVTIGLLGAAILFSLWIAAIKLMFLLAKISPSTSFTRQFFIIAAIYTIYKLIYALVGGTGFPIQSAIMVSFGISYLLRESLLTHFE